MLLAPFLAGLSCLLPFASAIGQELILTFNKDDPGLQLGGPGLSPTIRLASNDWPGVIRAANDLAVDFGRVLGRNGTVVTNESTITNPAVIIVGTIGRSSVIDSLVQQGKIDVTAVRGQWETFKTEVVENPIAGVAKALVIAGSDKRGSIFGIYDVSEQIGVSPWYWWADVPPKKKEYIYAAPVVKKQGPPSVKYRGIFLNDEQPALTNWVREKYGDFNVRFHRPVFELLLRLKANYLWPVMWNNRFYTDDAQNGPEADMYGIVMGTSHTEPMARADKEKTAVGRWDWGANQQGVRNYMQQGVTRARNWETLWTLGMRGNGDEASPTLTASQLAQIIQFQQGILRTTLGVSDVGTVPQMWCLYKEVAGYYQQGMQVPDNIILLWSDDNNGNIQRLPQGNEVNRPGGAGVYYHFDYVGAPRNYKWINSMQMVKTWEQMHLAYERNAKKIWIVNVGDLKPMELPISHFLDMAYDITQFKETTSTYSWLIKWATREFNSAVAEATAKIITIYGRLIVRRRYESLNSNNPAPFQTANYNEAERILAEWVSLLADTQKVYDSLDTATQSPFFQMVLHPVLAGKTVQEIYIKALLSERFKAQKRMSCNRFAAEARAAFEEDKAITRRYHSLHGGKWNRMMDQIHIGYNNWQDPAQNTMPTVHTLAETSNPANGIMGVSVQGSAASIPGEAVPSMLAVSPYLPPDEKREIYIYCRGRGSFTYTITTNVTFVTLTPSTGTVTYPGTNSDATAVVGVNWDQAPTGISGVAITIRSSTGTSTTLNLRLDNRRIPSNFHGFVESTGAIAIEPAHWTTATNTSVARYVEIPDYGNTHSGVMLLPILIPSQTTSSGPKLSYSLYTFTAASQARLTVYLSSSLSTDTTRPLKYAFSFNNNNPTTVNSGGGIAMGNLPNGWERAVNSNSWVQTNTVNLPAGANTLNLWALEPGVIFQRIVIDLGGVKASYLGPFESWRTEDHL